MTAANTTTLYVTEDDKFISIDTSHPAVATLFPLLLRVVDERDKLRRQVEELTSPPAQGIDAAMRDELEQVDTYNNSILSLKCPKCDGTMYQWQGHRDGHMLEWRCITCGQRRPLGWANASPPVAEAEAVIAAQGAATIDNTGTCVCGHTKEMHPDLKGCQHRFSKCPCNEYREYRPTPTPYASEYSFPVVAEGTSYTVKAGDVVTILEGDGSTGQIYSGARGTVEETRGMNCLVYLEGKGKKRVLVPRTRLRLAVANVQPVAEAGERRHGQFTFTPTDGQGLLLVDPGGERVWIGSPYYDEIRARIWRASVDAAVSRIVAAAKSKACALCMKIVTRDLSKELAKEICDSIRAEVWPAGEEK